MKKPRKHHRSDEKLAILRRHLLEKVPVSDLCDEYGIHPTLFYNWQKQLFENGAAVFERNGKGSSKRLEEVKDRKIATLEQKLHRKNEVLSEVMEEHVQLKKELGEP